MSSAPTLSIVIVNWNTRDLLLKVLGQLFDAPRLATEVIVMDDQSSDDCVAAAQRAFPEARVLPQPKNGGFAYGVNRGLEAATGKWILLFNTDAELDWEQLEGFVDEAEGATGIFGPRITDEHGAPNAALGRGTCRATTCSTRCSSAASTKRRNAKARVMSIASAAASS